MDRGIRGVPAPLASATSTLSASSYTMGVEDNIAIFDPSRQTSDVYCRYSGAEARKKAVNEEVHAPVFRQARMMVDSEYHGIYTLSRQAVQDRIVMAIFERGGMTIKADGTLCEAADLDIQLEPASPIMKQLSEPDTTPARPFAVWTAGAMGAGKGHTLRTLKQAASVFPIEAFVAIDPDEIKSVLPDTPLYLEANQATGSGLVHKESTYVAEIAENVAFIVGASLLVDGSLRDHRWYSPLFQRYAKEHPEYRLGIIHVHAPAEVVRARAAARAAQTGRVVPPEVLEGAIEAVPKSVAILSSLVEFAVTIDNGSATGPPSFVAPHTAEAFSRIWDGIRGGWVSRLYEEHMGIAPGEPVDEVIGKQAATKARLANATAHAAARALDAGREPVHCDLRAPAPRRPALAAMNSMASASSRVQSLASGHFPRQTGIQDRDSLPSGFSEGGVVGAAGQVAGSSSAAESKPGRDDDDVALTSVTTEFAAATAAFSLKKQTISTSPSEYDTRGVSGIIRPASLVMERETTYDSMTTMSASTSLQTTLTTRVGRLIDEVAEDGEMSFNHLAELLEAEQLRAAARRSQRRRRQIRLPSAASSLDQRTINAGVVTLPSAVPESSEASPASSEMALSLSAASSVYVVSDESSEALKPHERGEQFGPRLAIIESAAESIGSSYEAPGVHVMSGEQSSEPVVSSKRGHLHTTSTPATAKGVFSFEGGAAEPLTGTRSAISMSGSARLGASMSASSVESRGFGGDILASASGAGGMTFGNSVSGPEQGGAGQRRGLGRSATAASHGGNSRWLASREAWMDRRCKVGLVNPAAAMRIWLTHRMHQAADEATESESDLDLDRTDTEEFALATVVETSC